MEGVIEANRNIAALQTSLESAQNEIEVVKAACDAEVRRREDEQSEMQSKLDTRIREVAEANQRILDLQAAVDVAQKQVETVDAERRRTGQVTEVLQRVPSVHDFRQWMRESAIDANTPISDDDPSNSPSVVHHVLAHNALIHTRHQNWDSACEDAQKSIDARESAMGYIVKAHAQIGRGKQEEATQALDLALANADSHESNLLLLIKPAAGDADVIGAITRLQNLILIVKDDETKYCCIQVLAKMHQEQGDSERAAESRERGQALTATCTGYHLETITLASCFCRSRDVIC
ncbi:hypothetical protein JVU11DRAFT_8175 [Chiua virens]|nr:hypothetical protein JVU11DRAFT_8175 [Chiua virens]